ncbi:signal peptidase I [Micromonospora chokoriensis]|uniref:Signal peptidase I n=2 Tax=Micromonospora chokoriensis TaxID=356851 RepID=A0A1C4WZA7_9ACTN|nr:signal peptidase I [Micromonospora chokoriensis]
MQSVIALLLVVSAAVAVLVAMRRRFLLATVEGHSMVPTLEPGDRLLVRRTSLTSLNVGDIVVVAPDARMAGPRPRAGLVIKRLVALPGGPVPADVPCPEGNVLPMGRMAILGDNPSASRDSRHYGLVAEDRLVGVVVRSVGRRPSPTH